MHNQRVILSNEKNGQRNKKLARINNFCSWLAIALIFVLGQLLVAVASRWTDVSNWVSVLATSALLLFVVLFALIGMMSKD